MQLPIGLEHNFEGVVDLLREEALFFDGPNGEDVRREPIPTDMVNDVKAARQHMLETISMYSDEMMELLLAEEHLPLELVDRVIREAVLGQQLTPVFIGSAYKVHAFAAGKSH
jgi:elongation factor G